MQTNLLISYIIALAIPAFAVYLIFALDLYGTGKGSTVLACVAWGAVGAYLIVRYVINRPLQSVFGYDNMVLYVAPITEELVKALFLVWLIQRPRFRYVVDGAVYGFAAGIGFAVSENIFVYLPIQQNAALVGMISRVLSATLMHATASALNGIALGRLRRRQPNERIAWPLVGIIIAIALHMAFNNAIQRLEGPVLLLIGIGTGAVGFVLIFILINEGIAREKQRFAQTLGLNVGVSSSERRAVQQLGGDAVEEILKNLGDFFGEDKVPRIRRLLVIQANIGILQNNLSSPASERLHKAWQEEISVLRKEINTLRSDLGLYVMSFLRGVFPEEDESWSSISKEIEKSDPTQVHSFDIFIRASEMAGTVAPEQLEQTAQMLQKAEIFKDVSLADLENLSRAVMERNFRPGEIIFKQGDEGDTMYMIRQGKIDLYLQDHEGNEKLLRTSRAGDVVGELALLDGSPRSAGARANGSVVALRLRREHFLMFIQSRPQVIIAVLRFLANRVRTTTQALETSVAWATNITEGKYQEARTVGMLGISTDKTPAEPLPASENAPPQQASAAERALVVPTLLGGAFGKVAAALEKRDQQETERMTGTFSVNLDMSELPEAHQQVLKVLLRDPDAQNRGLTHDILRSRLDNMEALPTVLQELGANDWLIITGEPPEQRYRINLNRRKGRSLSLPLFKPEKRGDSPTSRRTPQEGD